MSWSRQDAAQLPSTAVSANGTLSRRFGRASPGWSSIMTAKIGSSMTAAADMDPCWILGYPKSGTTLLLSLLDGHAKLSVFPEELRYFSNVCGKADRIGQILSNTGFRALLSGGKVRSQGGLRDYSALPVEEIAREIRSLRDRRLSNRDLLIHLMEIWRRHASGAPAAKRYWVEKTPGNEKNLLRMHRWFGHRSTYLYIIRDPRDVYCSLARARRGTNKELTPETFAVGWILSALIASWAERHLARFKLIRYEDLVRSPAAGLEAICAHLGIEYSADLLTPTRAGQRWRGNSMHGQEFQGVSSPSIGIYRGRLPGTDVATLERLLFISLKRFGYAAAPGCRPSRWAAALSRVRFLKWYMQSQPWRSFVSGAGQGL